MTNNYPLSNAKQVLGMQVGSMGCVPACGSVGDSRNVSFSQISFHKRLWGGTLKKWLTRSASDAKKLRIEKGRQSIFKKC